MGKALLISILIALGVVAGCGDSGTNSSDEVFSGITGTDGNGVYTSFDPDDWCLGDIILTDELMIPATHVYLAAWQPGSTGGGRILVFNRASYDVTIQLKPFDSHVYLDSAQTIPSGQSVLMWIGYRTDDYYPHHGLLSLTVEPDGEPVFLSYTGYTRTYSFNYGTSSGLGYAFATPQFLCAAPNPATFSTRMTYNLPRRRQVKLIVVGPDRHSANRYVLVDEVQDIGLHSVEWDVWGLEPGIYRAYLSVGLEFECSGDIQVVEAP